MHTSINISGRTKRIKILTFLRDFIDINHYSPSYREIAEECDLASISTVAHHLNILIAEGFIEKTSFHSRSIRITSKGKEIL